MDNNIPDIPCQNAMLTLKHMLLDCPAYQAQRQRMNEFDSNRTVTLKDLLGEDICITEICQYLKSISMYDCV